MASAQRQQLAVRGLERGGSRCAPFSSLRAGKGAIEGPALGLREPRYGPARASARWRAVHSEPVETPRWRRSDSRW
jgi:hypothetical protein